LKQLEPKEYLANKKKNGMDVETQIKPLQKSISDDKRFND
jgi:hypothetical protein